jgi:uncharacterized protein YyaL (SSP411 family)
MTEKLLDEKIGGFYTTGKGKTDLLLRGKDAHDSSVPAGNAVAAHALLRLARLTDNKDYFARAKQTLALFSAQAGRAPTAFARLLCAVDFHHGPSREIVIAGGPGDESTKALLNAVRQRYLPNAVVALVDPGSGGAAATAKALPLLDARPLVEGKAAAYVCENYACKAPVTSAGALTKLLETKPKSK